MMDWWVDLEIRILNAFPNVWAQAMAWGMQTQQAKNVFIHIKITRQPCSQQQIYPALATLTTGMKLRGADSRRQLGILKNQEESFG